ncbi:MAG: hypothetical protein AABX76_01760 [Nanoarchaeota archaeon]
MELAKILLRQKGPLTLRVLQELQTEYDHRFVDLKFTGFDKVRHTYAHLGKLMGRLADYVEAREENREVSEEDIKTKVIPDLLVYSSWLAREFNVDLSRAYLKRFVGNVKRLHGDEIPSDQMVEIESSARKVIGYK